MLHLDLKDVYSLEIFVGRQPIFNIKQELYGYELLNRNGNVNQYQELDGDKATLDVLANSFLSIGIDKLANGKKCFINFTERLIVEDLPTFFNKDTIVIELLEDIKCTKQVLDACARLKSLGYTIALDDYVFQEENKALIKYADIIKIDFLITSVPAMTKLISEVEGKNIVLLAEKVESREEFEIAKSLGFQLFQGYFFSKPVVINAKDVPQVNQNYYLLLEMIDRPEPDINEITEIIEREFSLTYKLLKIVNSKAYQMRNSISSIKQAIMILGLSELRKLVMVLACTTNQSKDKEVVKLSLCRAKFFESIAKMKRDNTSEYFLFGLFSLIDTILERPMENILSDLPLTLTIKEALQGKEGKLNTTLNLLYSLERGNSGDTEQLCVLLELSEQKVFKVYWEAIDWSDSLFATLEYMT